MEPWHVFRNSTEVFELNYSISVWPRSSKSFEYVYCLNENNLAAEHENVSLSHSALLAKIAVVIVFVLFRRRFDVRSFSVKYNIATIMRSNSKKPCTITIRVLCRFTKISSTRRKLDRIYDEIDIGGQF